IDFQVKFDILGPHSLTVVIDGADRIPESDEFNNQAICSFDVISPTSNRPPKADGGNDRSGYVGKAMLFSAKYSYDPDHDPLEYSWDFGDGTTGSGMRVNHVYEEVGDYGAELTVSDGMYSDKDAFTVHVLEAPTNKAPTAIILASSKKVLVNEDVTLDGSSSTDLDGDELEFEWTIVKGAGATDRVRGPKVTYSWGSPGHFKVTLEVSDGTDESTTDVVIEVGSPPPPNEPPVASAGADMVVKKGEEWVLRGVGYDTDGIIVSYEWDLDNDGVYDTYDEFDGSISHKFEEAGYVTVKLRVTDDQGGTHVDSMVITVKESKTDDKATPSVPAFVVILAVLGTALLVRRWRIPE
ncbi:MAG: PKD domain-containing protein, partial [Thermoplasmata archaeon]